MPKFTTLRNVANFIDRHHTVFGCPFAESTLTTLGKMNREIMETAMVGATFHAWLKIEGQADLPTLITIEKHPKGWWEVTEIIDTERVAK